MLLLVVIVPLVLYSLFCTDRMPWNLDAFTRRREHWRYSPWRSVASFPAPAPISISIIITCPMPPLRYISQKISELTVDLEMAGGLKPGLVKGKQLPYEPIAKYTEHFEDPSETPPAKLIETIPERRARVREAKLAAHTAALEAAVEAFDPSADEKLKDTDPYRTLFVGRMSYETTEDSLRKAFETQQHA